MMDQSPHKINNSYESPSSGSATSSSSAGDSSISRFMNNFNFNNGYALSNLLMPNATDFELYNTSAEEGIFPNVAGNCPVVAPSYEPDYDYYNQYSTTPLVYSWMPIVPGFSQERTDNLHKFDHIIKKQHPQPLNISNISTEENSSVLSDQNAKFADSLVLNNSDSKHYILNNSSGMTFNHQLDNSCNAMDLNISCHIQKENVNLELSFNGKIPELTTRSLNEDSQLILKKSETASPEECVNIECEVDNTEQEDEKQEKQDECVNSADESEKLRNESFEILKQEDSTKMIMINKNEKSPEVTESRDEYQDDSDEQQTSITIGRPEISPKTKRHQHETKMDERKIPTLKDREDFLFNRFQSSLSEMCPPPSITTLPLSLSEMIAIYKRNLEKPQEAFAPIQSNLMFIPSHPLNETLTMEWPKIVDVNAPGIFYNRSTDCEQIEFMTVKYVERHIKAETASSYNHKVGPSSAKKKIEKLKLLTQSPSSRLSHLANRRKVFSSANLKSASATTSHKSFAIDKSKLYQKKKRTSAKKKTPGKRKTPKSAKRQSLQISKIEPAGSKRALFISPMKSNSENTSMFARLNRDIPIRGQLPKRTLFSPTTQNSKRKRSPSPDDENKYGKSRRLDSPSRILKSKSFSIAVPSSSSGSLEEHFRKTLNYRVQSETMLNQLSETSKSNIGYRKQFTDIEKKKLLWTASAALQSKQINREHEKFKEYMSTLCKLVKRVFTDFYNPAKGVSVQMTKFSNMMVFYVIQGRPADEIFLMMKNKLEAQNPTKISGYIGQEEYQKNLFIRKNTSLLMMSSNSCSSLNLTDNNDSILDGSFDRSGSDTSLNRSNVNETNVLRENFSSNYTTSSNSAKKLFSGSDTNLNVLKKTNTPSSNVLKAKRQISF